MDLTFLDTVLEHSFLPLYGLVVVLAIWRYPRYFDTPLRYFPILLAYTFLNEVLGNFIQYNDEISLVLIDLYTNNNWLIYNIYNVIFYLYFFYVYWKYISHVPHKKWIVAAGLIFATTSILNPFYQNFLLETQLYAYLVGAILLICCAVLFFMDLHSRYGTWFLKRDLLSWVSLGILIFYSGYMPIKIVRYYEALEGFAAPDYVRRIHLLLILFMYGSFAFGFYRMRRRHE